MPETYRLRLIAATAGAARAHRLGWSRWRRTQLARAQRAHIRRRAPAAPPLTPAAWAAIVPLLPVAASRGRPRRPAQRILAGILWVMHTGAPWRAIPIAYGPWSTCHDRYRRWQRDGTWTHIYAALVAPPTRDIQLLL